MKERFKEVFIKTEQWIGRDPRKGERKSQLFKLYARNGQEMFVQVQGAVYHMSGAEVTEAITEILNKYLEGENE